MLFCLWIASWRFYAGTVHGLNDPAKRSAIREFIASMRVRIICLQETRLNFDHFLVCNVWGHLLMVMCICWWRRGEERRGGILLAWNKSIV
jgi:hypothetical protein